MRKRRKVREEGVGMRREYWPPVRRNSTGGGATVSHAPPPIPTPTTALALLSALHNGALSVSESHLLQPFVPSKAFPTGCTVPERRSGLIQHVRHIIGVLSCSRSGGGNGVGAFTTAAARGRPPDPSSLSLSAYIWFACDFDFSSYCSWTAEPGMGATWLIHPGGGSSGHRGPTFNHTGERPPTAATPADVRKASRRTERPSKRLRLIGAGLRPCSPL